VQFGGNGRAVMGRMEYNSAEKLNFYGTLWAQDHGMRAPPNWREMSAEEKRKYVRSWRGSPQGERFKNEVGNFEFPVKPDGTFWVDDVRPGRYRMQVRTDAKVPKGQSPRLAAMAEIHIDVPEAAGNSDAPVDVGTLYPHAL